MTKALLMSASAVAIACAMPAMAHAQSQGTAIEELVVTAQKREESLQDVPIAVSAFSQEALKAQGIDTAGNLVQSVPNLTFTRRSLRTNFQIRGIGAQLISITGDDGVGIHENNAPLTYNRLGDAEFFDVERVEVLRGPQGTLYGRNATGGVVNMITNKPTRDLSGSFTAEFGNFKDIKYQGFINVPLGETLAVRAAGFALQREGYTKNLLNGQNIDSRKIWAGRVTVAWNPTDAIRAWALWDTFSEDDSRGARKQLCEKDLGPAAVLGVPTGAARAGLTQGCLPTSVYDPASYGTTNQLSSFSGIIARQVGLQPLDSFQNKFVSKDLREVEVVGRPIYRPRGDLYELNLEWDITPQLTLSSLTSNNENEYYSRGDSTGGYSSVPFANSALAPGGILIDPKFGQTDRLISESGSIGHNNQWTQELRLQSNFDGPINFNVGGIYVKFKALNFTYVATNAATAALKVLVPTGYIDPNREPDFSGHNYYVSRAEYELHSKAAFGELYWQATDTLKATLGLRYTDDEKWTRGSASTLFTPGRGPVYDIDPISKKNEFTVQFKETTGRFNVDWSPDLAFTDSTLIYASYSKGYKGGGFNPVRAAALGFDLSYEPEFVNAYEIGTKNTLLDGALILNLTGFYYDYQGYQIATSVNRSVINDNIDAKIKGLELESIWQPIEGLRLNANVGYLDTRIEKGEVIDPWYRNQGNPNYVYGNTTSGGCILNATGVAAILSAPGGPGVLANRACSGTASIAAGLVAAGNTSAAAAALAAGAYPSGPNIKPSFNIDANGNRVPTGSADAVLQNLEGNELPNAPKWTLSLGAQYKWNLPKGWDATLRGDYYQQSESFMRYNNEYFDRIKAWHNVNASLIFDNRDLNLNVQLFVKNLEDKDTIVGFDIADENLGSVRNIILLDPRTYGISITKGF